MTKRKNSRVKKSRYLAIILAVVMVAGLFPYNMFVSAATDGTLGGYDFRAVGEVTALIPPVLAAGQIWTDRSVSENPNGSFTVTLRALGNKFTDDKGNLCDPLVTGSKLIITDSFNSVEFGFSSNDGLTADDGVVTWTLDAGSLNLNGVPNKVTYTLTLKPSVYRDNGEYYTHTKAAEAVFDPIKGNTYYWTVENKTENAFEVSNISWNNGSKDWNNITITDKKMEFPDGSIGFTAVLKEGNSIQIKGQTYTYSGNKIAAPNAGDFGSSAYRYGMYKSGPYKSTDSDGGAKYRELLGLAAGTAMANSTEYYEYLFWFYGLNGPGSVVVYQIIPDNPGGNKGAPGFRFVSYTEWQKKDGVGWKNDGVHMSLTNKGYIKLVNAQLDPVDINVTKTISSYAGVGGGTFNFVLYADAAKSTRVDGAEISASFGNPGTKTISIPKEFLNFAGDKTSKTFYLVETAPADATGFWTYDTAVREVVVASNGEVKIGGAVTSSVNFTNKYSPLGQLAVEKIWANTPDDEKCPIDVYLVDSKGAKVENSDTELNKGNNWTATFYGLLYGETYNVIEDANALNTDFDVPVSSGKVTLVYGAEQKVTITNAYNTPKGTITVVKDWVHGGNDDNPLLAEVMVYLYKDGALDQAGMTSGGVKVFSGLDMDKTYVVTEDVPQDYLLTTSEAQRTFTPNKSDRDRTITLTNVFQPRQYELTIVKEWIAVPGIIPPSVDVEIFKDGISFKTVTLTKDGKWTTTLTTQADGIVPGVYTIEERTLDDYFTVTYITDDGMISKAKREGTLQVTNTDDDPKGTITVNKVWADNNQTSLRSESVTVTLLMDGDPYTQATLSGDNNWKATFTNLELEAEYTVEESGSPDLYTKSYSDSVFLTRGKNNHAGSITIINTYDYGVLTVSKTWVHGDNIGESNYLSVGAELYLYKIGEDGIPVLVEDLPFSVGYQNSSKTYYYLDLDATYYVEEYVNDQYYKKAISPAVTLDEENPNGAIFVTNTYEAPTGSISVEKKWLGSNRDPFAPSSIVVGLFFGAEESPRDTITLSGPNWSGVFTGVQINKPFEVREISDLGLNYKDPIVVNGNVTLGKYDLSASVTVKNEYIPPVGKLAVAKDWGSDEPAAGEMRPEYITVQLMRSIAGGAAEAVGGQIEISWEDDWYYVFEDLLLYDADGNRYTYSVVEMYVKGYIATYSSYGVELSATNTGAEAGVITITNEFQTDVGRITAVKDWKDVPEELRTPVRVALYKDGSYVRGSGRILNARHNWRTTWSRLELGATYSVKELTTSEDWSVTYGDGDSFSDAYGVTLTRMDESGTIVVRNTYIVPDHEIKLEKGADDEAVIIGETATINYEIKVTNDGNRTLTDIEVTDAFSDFPDDANIVFIVETEGMPYEYNEETGVFTIATLAPGEFVIIKYTVKADLKGDYVNDASATAVYRAQDIYSNEDNAKTEVLRPELALEKTVTTSTSQTLSSGSSSFGYKLKIGNNGDVDVTITSLKDVMSGPAGSSMTYTVTSDGVTYDAEENSFIFENGLILAPGEDFTITYNVAVNTAGTYDNNAEVEGYYVVNDEKVQLSARANKSVKTDNPVIPIIDDDDPVIPTTPVEIPVPEVPLVELPVIEEAEVPEVLAEVFEPVEIEDPDTPLAILPQTGVVSIYNIIFLAGAALIAIGMAARLAISVSKKNKNRC